MAAWPCLASSYEAKIYVVTRWDAGCPGSAAGYLDDMADAWYDEITDDGWWFFGHGDDAYTRAGRQVNGNIVNSKFADPNVVGWGNDVPYLDDGDAVLVAWHGTELGDVYVGLMRVDEPGAGDCWLRQDEMELGDTDLEFLHLASCDSMDENQWSSWTNTFNGLHQIDGFHGCMWIGQRLVDDYSDFADDAFSESISGSWLDNMHRPNISGTDDQCPVALAVGVSGSDCFERLYNERYDKVYGHPIPFTHGCVRYFAGCDPFGKPGLEIGLELGTRNSVTIVVQVTGEALDDAVNIDVGLLVCPPQVKEVPALLSLIKRTKLGAEELAQVVCPKWGRCPKTTESEPRRVVAQGRRR